MTTAPEGDPGFRLRDLTYSAYIPTILFSIGQGAVIPIIPLFAKDLGASLAFAAFIVAMRNIGQLIFDMPAGIAVSRWGDKGAMVAGTAMVATVAIGASFSPNEYVLAPLILLMGGGWAFWQLARLAYVSEIAPIEQRGRALSMLGGMNRVGNFIGPVIGGVLGKQFGLESAFYAQAVMGLAASAMMFVVVKENATSENIDTHDIGGKLIQTFKENQHIFLITSIPILALTLLRQARQIFLPLWGDEIGLNVAEIGLVTSISFFADAAIFYPVGAVMDKFGRKWAAVPCLTSLAIGFLVLPLTSEIYGFTILAIGTGIGNGFGAGINMTLGADFAPPNARGEFLGLWRVISDSGGAIGPVVISVLTGIGSLALASLATGGIGLIGGVIMALFVPEPLKRSLVRQKPKPTPTST